MFKKTNRPFLIAAGLAIVVTGILILNRHWDLKASINESVLEAWGTIMGAIFTAVTVYLLYKQNQQQLDDRKAANQPDLYLAVAHIFTIDAKKNEEDGNKKPSLGNKILFSEYVNQVEKKFEIFFPIQLHNIGLGAAKQIKYKWKFNREDVFKFVDGAYNLPINFEEKKFYGETTIDFIAPNNYSKVYIPYYYCTCFGMSINRNNNDGYHKEVPKLDFHIEYLDIYNNVIDKIFNVTFDRIFEYVDIKFNEIAE